MRIIQTVNDTIRLLFNPKTEIFRLSDFLLVRDNFENFLAQVIEVYDDKFDQESNIAKIKLIYRIVNGNEIAPFDNYTPSRECEVAKIRQSEIERCINLNKKTISLGKSFHSEQKTEINTDFFDNNCVIFADKFEQTNQIFENLAPRLCDYKHVLVLDFSGTCFLDDAKAFSALETFKLPLSSFTADYIQQKKLTRAKLETQVVLGDVFEAVKASLNETDENYIPFQEFIKIIENQYKQTPSVELLVLISWMKKYSREKIFAQSKKEYSEFFKSIKENKITTLDLSAVKAEWQKEYFEFIINQIKEDIFVLIRLNDNNVNNDILNNIYLKKKNITLIPSFAYGYKKASYIMEFAQNYILLPTLNPKRDFAHANFQIQALNKESYMIFGEDTKDFIFTVLNEPPVRRQQPKEEFKDKMFISLNLQLEDMTPLELRPNNFEIKTVEPKKRRLQEEIKLSDILEIKDTITQEEVSVEEPEKTVEETEEEIQNNDIQVEEPVIEEIKEETPIEAEPVAEKSVDKEEPEIETKAEEIMLPIKEELPEETDILGEDELDYFERAEENIINETTPEKTDEKVENDEIIDAKEIEEQIIKEQLKEQELENQKKEAQQPVIVENVSEEKENNEENADTNEIKEKIEISETTETPQESEAKEEEVKMPAKADLPKIKETITENEFSAGEMSEFAKTQEVKEETKENVAEIKEEREPETPTEEEVPSKNESGVDDTHTVVSTIIDDIVKEKTEEALNASQVEENTHENEAKSDLIEEINNEKTAEDEELDRQFSEILNEEQVEKTGKEVLKVDEKVSIDIEKIKKDVQKKEAKLPIFTESESKTETPAEGFREGGKVSHEKYGTGEILKVIQYGDRCLLQIEFPEVGKRLLDPKIAKLQTASEV